LTYLTFAIGAFALAAIPPFSGFYSKDAIIEAVHLSTTPGAGYAYICVLIGAFITPLYIFRALFLTFHGESRVDSKLLSHVHESPWVVLIPLILLAVPSMIAGGMLIAPMLYDTPHLLGDSIFVLPEHDVLLMLSTEFHGAQAMALHAPRTLTFWLTLLGVTTAWLFNLGYPSWSQALQKRFSWVYAVLVKKFGFDDFNQIVIVHGARRLGEFFYQVTDLLIIDGLFVNGSGKFIRWFANVARQMQTGYLYHYALAMILGLVGFLGWFLLG
jgi:NADH-quinone oxidoreductase subunit L